MQMQLLSPSVRWKADNYNHLLEQPTLFYAIPLVLAMLGQGDDINLVLAWTYVGLCIAHSLVQVLINKIEARFSLFILSSIVLVWMTVNAVLNVIWSMRAYGVTYGVTYAPMGSGLAL